MRRFEIPPGPNLDLLLIGKTGVGKSATGNSILGRDEFKVSHNPSYWIKNPNSGAKRYGRRELYVMDIPGLFDTEDPDINKFESMLIKKMLPICDGGFHAILLVIRPNVGMSREEIRAIHCVERVLGIDVIKDNTVCIVTRGDELKSHTDVPFETWCREQKGFVGYLFEKCDYKCVLFDNKTRDINVRQEQMIQLLSKIEEVKSSTEIHTVELLQAAQIESRRGERARYVKLQCRLDDALLSAVNCIDEEMNQAFEDIRSDAEHLLEETRDVSSGCLSKVRNRVKILRECLDDIKKDRNYRKVLSDIRDDLREVKSKHTGFTLSRTLAIVGMLLSYCTLPYADSVVNVVCVVGVVIFVVTVLMHFRLTQNIF